jgi:hypothetical protein
MENYHEIAVPMYLRFSALLARLSLLLVPRVVTFEEQEVFEFAPGQVFLSTKLLGLCYIGQSK